MAIELPESVTAIGEQLSGNGSIEPDPQLLNGADVFAAERQRLFLRPWVAVDHHSRIEEPDRYVRFDAASRSVLLTRDTEGKLRALRNVCIHAGYPVCEAEEGAADRLVCPYHGWEFAADGRLLEPDLSSRIDPARLRLATHPVCVQDGLIFVDLSKPAAASEEVEEPPAAPGLIPAWLTDATVAGRSCYSTDWNWKLASQFVKSSPQLFCSEPDQDDFIEFGPLSFMLAQPNQAILLRVIPKSASRTDIQVVRMVPPGVAPEDQSDRVAAELKMAGDAENVARTAKLDRAFFGWYWSLMSRE